MLQPPAITFLTSCFFIDAEFVRDVYQRHSDLVHEPELELTGQTKTSAGAHESEPLPKKRRKNDTHDVVAERLSEDELVTDKEQQEEGQKEQQEDKRSPVASFVGPHPPQMPPEYDSVFRLTYPGGKETGISFSIKSQHGLRVLSVSEVRDGPFLNKLRRGDVIDAINSQRTGSMIDGDAPLDSLVDLIQCNIRLAVEKDEDLVLLCHRPGTDAELQEVSDHPVSTPSSPRQQLNDDFPIGLTVRVKDPSSDPIEGVVSRTLSDGTIHVQPDKMNVGRTIVVRPENHADIESITTERRQAMAAKYSEEIRRRPESLRDNTHRRAASQIAEKRINAVKRGIAPKHWGLNETRGRQDDDELRFPCANPISFHDPYYLLDSNLVRRSRMRRSDFSISAGLKFAENGQAAASAYERSVLFRMRNTGDEIEADGPLIDDDASYLGKDVDQFDKVPVVLYGNKYIVHPNKPTVGFCTRDCCKGRIVYDEGMDDQSLEKTHFHKIAKGHSLRCQVSSLVENKSSLGLRLTDEQVESVLAWFIQVEIGIIVHPHVSKTVHAPISFLNLLGFIGSRGLEASYECQ